MATVPCAGLQAPRNLTSLNGLKDAHMSHRGKPVGLFTNLSAKIAAIPMVVVAVVVFVGCSVWTIVYSFSNSRLLPKNEWVGLAQYERLWSSRRWIISIENLAIYGSLMLILSLVIGFVLAALIDQKIRFEDGFRTIFLYPHLLS